MGPYLPREQLRSLGRQTSAPQHGAKELQTPNSKRSSDMNVQSKLSISGSVAPATGGSCRLCGEELAYDMVDLGMSPLCESFLPADRLDEVEHFFPLHAYVCDNCF